MRNLKVILLVISLTFLFVPITNASATPVIVWPQSDLLNREEASNLTTWFADQLDVQIDTSKDGEWDPVNESGRPEFLLAKEAYALPLVDGEIEAQYIEAGILRNIEFQGNSSYVAKSVEESDLRKVTDRIASDLGLNTSQSQLGIEFVVLLPGTPQEEYQWLIIMVEPTDLGDPLYFNILFVTVRESDLRVISVKLFVWYELLGVPDYTASDAVNIASEFAFYEYNATNPNGTSSAVTVRNGTSFVYQVHVTWEEGPGSFWTLEVWVDSSSGEVLYHLDPYLVTEDVIPRHSDPSWDPWIPLVLIATFTIVVFFGVFYRLSAERALDQFNRGRIYGYIQANPGIKYTKIRESLGIKNGTLSYHLWVLERLGFVRSQREGRVRLLYPKGVPFSNGSLILSHLQFAILDILNAEGSMSQSDIARHFRISRQRAHYNVKMLRSLSLVQPTMDGRIELSQKGTETIGEIEERHSSNQWSQVLSHV
ncbi:MAG: winged helix-turn-helix transcriptional regulator [Thermoplasmata archaeon]|nr:MAG: winged helix-turn-helix transcriptional regulator [Thermoplasmata archaeon]